MLVSGLRITRPSDPKSTVAMLLRLVAIWLPLNTVAPVSALYPLMSTSPEAISVAAGASNKPPAVNPTLFVTSPSSPAAANEPSEKMLASEIIRTKLRRDLKRILGKFIIYLPLHAHNTTRA